MGICNKTAGILSPIILSLFVLKGINKLEEKVNTAPSEQAKEAILNDFASKVYVPYLVMAVILLALALWILRSSLPEIKGSEEAKELEKTLKWAASVAKNPGNVRRICELGIGLNPKASIIGAMIVDDKSLGTAHIGIGSNYWFGGNIYAIIHLDQVFKNPKIYLDGKLLKI